MFWVSQSVKTKETNPTRPGSSTPCKQALSLKPLFLSGVGDFLALNFTYKCVQTSNETFYCKCMHSKLKKENFSSFSRYVLKLKVSPKVLCMLKYIFAILSTVGAMPFDHRSMEDSLVVNPWTFFNLV